MKTMEMGRHKFIWLTLLLAVLLWLVSACGGYTFHGQAYDPPQPAPPIEGVNWDGTTFQLDQQKGKVVILFFGYSYCPDICPLTMAQLAQSYRQLGEKAKNLAVVFVSTDPDRDTPARLAEYIPAFDRSFYGIHLTPEQLTTVEQAYGVFAEPSATPDASAGYEIAHSTYLFVLDQTGNLRLLFPSDVPQADLIADLEQLMKS